MMISKAQLLALMQKGATVISPNNRLANELLNDFMQASGHEVQAKPRCFPYSAFLQDQFKKLNHRYPQTAHPLVLTGQQLSHLWRKVLSRDLDSPVNAGLLQAVVEAWTRCLLWQIDFSHPAFAQTPQTRQFQSWVVELQQELDRLGAITLEQLGNYLLSQPQQPEAETLIWACFDDYNPQQLSLQQYFSQQGCQLYHYDLAEQEGKQACYAAKDENDEYQQLIHWINDRLSKGEKRIALVVPSLQRESQHLQRLLQQALPASEFNISLGQSLAEYPLVAHAFCWLKLETKQLEVNQARLLLHSPYLAHSQTEMLARAQLLETSTALQEYLVEHASFLRELKSTAPKLAELVSQLVPYPQEATIKEWIRLFKNRLQDLGFPGEYPLNSASYQCYQRFLSLFDEFKQLSLISPSLPKAEALNAVVELAKSTVFQPQKPAVNVQILGLLEAAGCSFDSLWVSGLTDQCLPQKPRLSAFIPLSLQRDNKMPYACPARELQLAQKALNRLRFSSPNSVFSYPRLSEDKPNMPSPMLVDLPSFTAYESAESDFTSSLAPFVEQYQFAFIEKEEIAGGTALLANQAKCPFRAFAAHRLHAQSPLKVSDGPDAKERGLLIHKVMELLWRSLESQEKLLTLEAELLDQQIEQAIQQALEPLIQRRSYSFSPLIQEVELTRLKRLVQGCLDWERKRSPFTIEALEQTFNIRLAGIDFRVRVDRLDQIAEGEKWVIDYKTNLPQSLPWTEERPKEPQLLLYSLLDERIKGLLFTQLKAGQIKCKGLSEENAGIAGIMSIKEDKSWAEYRQNWQQQLNDLAEEFSKGHCPPQPSSASICQQCDFQSLCRFRVVE